MPELNFRLVDEPAAENEDYDEAGCQCPPGDTSFLLEIQEGHAVLIHTACGKQPPASWGDWHDLAVMNPIPVTVTWEPECDGSTWHGMTRCDHDSYVIVEADSVPADVRTAALELSRKHAIQRTSP